MIRSYHNPTSSFNLIAFITFYNTHIDQLKFAKESIHFIYFGYNFIFFNLLIMNFYIFPSFHLFLDNYNILIDSIDYSNYLFNYEEFGTTVSVRIHFDFDCGCSYFYVYNFTLFYHNFVESLTQHYQDNFSYFNNLDYLHRYGFG
jgi:hypothetical protein